MVASHSGFTPYKPVNSWRKAPSGEQTYVADLPTKPPPQVTVHFRPVVLPKHASITKPVPEGIPFVHSNATQLGGTPWKE
jgi:hypothetical protein